MIPPKHASKRMKKTYPEIIYRTSAPLPWIAISPCLVGFPTRYDGRDKRIALPGLDMFNLILFCPEQSAGLGTPREPIRLVSSADGTTHVAGVNSEHDFTSRFSVPCRRMAEFLHKHEVLCFILKARSPSCGVISPLFTSGGIDPVGASPGIWADMILKEFPDIPVFTEDTLPPEYLQQKAASL